MSEPISEREELARILAENGATSPDGIHSWRCAYPETGKFFRCTCGWTHRVDGMNGWDSWRARHDEHVVAVLAAHGGDA